MRRRIAGLTLFFLCLFVCCPVALADDVRVKVAADPVELSEAGSVDFSFEISNNSIYELHDVSIAFMGQSVSIMDKLGQQPIAPGGSVSGITLPFTVSDAQLGQPLAFTVSWLQGGEPFSQDVQCTVGRAANPTISVSRTASAEMAKQGDTITLTYELKNGTKFDMTDIVLLDENISDNPILRLDVLKANGTSTMTHQYRMGTEDVVSAPAVTYVVNGKSKVFSGLTPLTLSMMLVQLDMQVEAGVPTQGGVTFTLVVKNTGNQEVRDIQIADERGNPVNSAVFSLAAGDSVTYPYLVVPAMVEPLRNVSFKLSGTDAFGQPYTLAPGTSYEVYPFVDDSQINVMLRAETVTPWSAESGTVTSRIILTNYSTVALTNVVVTESTIGVIKTLDTLPAGETAFDQELLVGSPRNLQFSVKGNDPTGTARELANCLLPVAYSTDTASPSATAEPSQDRNPVRAFAFLSTTISKILVGLGVLMVLAFIVLVVLSVMERGRSGRLRFDEDEDDGDELDDIFGKDTPAKYGDDEPESEAEYFTKRIERAQIADAAGARKAQQPVISLPEPRVPVEYDAAPIMPADIFDELEAHTSGMLTDRHVVEIEPETDDAPPEPTPGEHRPPKVIATRRPPVVQPAVRSQVHYVRRDDSDR